jgi:hypothetical protein
MSVREAALEWQESLTDALQAAADAFDASVTSTIETMEAALSPYKNLD